MDVNISIERMNKTRKENGFMTIEELVELSTMNKIFDVFSTLISGEVEIGSGNIIYPNIVIQRNGGRLIIGENNIFFSNTRIISENGEIIIGNNNEIGENSISIKSVNKPIEIRNECRLMNGAQIGDGCYLGNGSQVLGNIKMAKCTLVDGKSYKEKNPNNRGGVLKGNGIANDLKVDVGMVISGNGYFLMKDCIRQEVNHPNRMNENPR